MQKNETLKTIASLRTTHWGFSEKKVSREDIEIIIEHSLRTANSDNLTDYSVIVVDDPETLQKITGGGIFRQLRRVSCVCCRPHPYRPLRRSAGI